MSGPVRFHLDEHIDLAIARALRREGVDVTTTVDAGLRTTTDFFQIRYAVDTGRAL